MTKNTIPESEYPLPVHHDGSARYVSPADPQPGEAVILRLRHAPALAVERLLLRTAPDGEQLFTAMQPEPFQPGDACRWWRVTLQAGMPLTGYRFLLLVDGQAWWYNAAGLHAYPPLDGQDFRLLAGYQAPEWVRQAVFYQVFPDRFADGDPSCTVRDGEYEYRGLPARARRWGERPASGRQAMVEFFGGDLPGITAHLDYISDLGANAVYLNPVFSALSNHRYDVTDYENVDPHLGGNPALAALRLRAEALGLRYILDIVPNHCGVMHPWFQAALADPNAPSAEYFTIRQRPDDYEAWLGVRTLPKLNYRSQALRQVMYAGPHAVFHRWLRPPYAADGWRIDVANMLARQGADQLGTEVSQGIRQAVKAENPQAYLLGENFFDATSQLQGDMWDAVMNYAGFTIPLWHWLSGFKVHVRGDNHPATAAPITTQALVDTWQEHRAAIPWAIARQQFNLLGSHDTQRLRTLLRGNQALIRLAIALLFTYPGVPCIYYGDEIGLGGDETEGQRQCMIWDASAWDHELRARYQTLARLRRSAPALIEGGFQMLLVEQDTLAYLRDSHAQTMLVVAQRGPAGHAAFPLPVANGGVPNGMEFSELFSGRRTRVENGFLPLPGLAPGVQVWVKS
jgi:alpha-glucosidase